MEPTDVTACFERTHAILRNDHFVYASGKHGSMYVNKKMLYTDARATAFLCKEMARRALAGFGPITCVVGPEKGGIILAQWVGYFFSAERPGCRVTSVFAEKSKWDIIAPYGGPHFIFSDEYKDFVRDKYVVLVDDVVNTGGSLRSLARLVRECGGNIRGAAVLWDRGDVTADDIEVPSLISLVNEKMESWPADNCSLCMEKKPINPHYGRGREFITKFITKRLAEESTESIARLSAKMPPHALRDYRGIVE